ncbi:MAG: LacI family DNA-binding transcriptional regulator [Clostridia bacterium]|nr:LacI family DNA-binding transcriptional regulator [Clostridia bacterium]
MKTTIKDIAKMAGVSTATVSKVVNHKDNNISEATRQRILNLIEEYNYVPNRVASSMVTKKTHSIGLVIPDITNPFFPEIARGVEDLANQHGYHVILCNSDNDLKKEVAYIAMLQEKMVDGIILTASAMREGETLDLGRIHVPVITVDRDIKASKIKGKIIVDNKSGAYEAVSYMLNKGYKRILHLAGPFTSGTSKERYEGYKLAHENFGLPIYEELFVEGFYTAEWGYEGIQRVLNEGIDFDGVFCANDLIALGALKALKEKGVKVPDDIGIVGFDDIYMTTLIEPRLTTVHQPNYQMGYKAAQMLVDFIEEKVVKEKKIILKTELIIRESS